MNDRQALEAIAQELKTNGAIALKYIGQPEIQTTVKCLNTIEDIVSQALLGSKGPLCDAPFKPATTNLNQLKQLGGANAD